MHLAAPRLSNWKGHWGATSLTKSHLPLDFLRFFLVFNLWGQIIFQMSHICYLVFHNCRREKESQGKEVNGRPEAFNQSNENCPRHRFSARPAVSHSPKGTSADILSITVGDKGVALVKKFKYLKAKVSWTGSFISIDTCRK